MFALRKPVAVVLINGQPLSIPDIAAQANAVLEAWYPGQEGGTALADILFGDANPGGKLPVTIARSIGQLPTVLQPEAERASRLSLRLCRAALSVRLWLSYTTFEIGTPRLSAARIAPTATVKVSVDVRNTGAVAGDEVVQLYVLRRRQLDHAAGQGAQGLSSRHIAARRRDDRGVHARQGCIRILERGDAVCRRARRVPHHGGTEFSRPSRPPC